MKLQLNTHKLSLLTYNITLSHQSKTHFLALTLAHCERVSDLKMSHCHDEHAGHGGHGHDHDHEHDHSDDITPAVQFSLYQQINFDEITTLNESARDSGKAVVKKPWAERLSVEPELQSDADEQLLMTVPWVPLSLGFHTWLSSK